MADDHDFVWELEIVERRVVVGEVLEEDGPRQREAYIVVEDFVRILVISVFYVQVQTDRVALLLDVVIMDIVVHGGLGVARVVDEFNVAWPLHLPILGGSREGRCVLAVRHLNNL